MTNNCANTTNAAAIIVAAGIGSRTGFETPKQFLPLAGKPVLTWSIDVFAAHSRIEQIVIVVSEDKFEFTHNLLASYDSVDVVKGGKERADSVRNAFDALKGDEPQYIFIHDAARPGLQPETLNLLFEALESYDGAAPGLPVSDALKRLETSGSITNVDRSSMYRIQTPQAFHYDKIRRAQEISSSHHADDFSIASDAGLSLTLTDGSERLHKITYKEDFERMADVLSRTLPPRIGNGFDVHAFEPGDAVMLCGVEIPHTHKLKGHSDADVAWHALTDAVLGALALGDIGAHFPPSDPQWKGAASSTFLKHANKLALAKGYSIGNVDVTVICEAPKVRPHVEAMQSATAECLGVKMEQVSIKATTTEQLGFTGRKEGIAAQASVLLVANPSTDGTK